jgi:hypothetical protein
VGKSTISRLTTAVFKGKKQRRAKVMAQFKSSEDYRNFDHAVRRQLRYVRGVVHDDFLQAVLETGVRRQLSLTNNTYHQGVWRAQLGLFEPEEVFGLPE